MGVRRRMFGNKLAAPARNRAAGAEALAAGTGGRRDDPSWQSSTVQPSEQAVLLSRETHPVLSSNAGGDVPYKAKRACNAKLQALLIFLRILVGSASFELATPAV